MPPIYLTPFEIDGKLRDDKYFWYEYTEPDWHSFIFNIAKIRAHDYASAFFFETFYMCTCRTAHSK